MNEEDIDDILATGSVPLILQFMASKNILGGQGSVKFSLRSVYWLCKDLSFYREGIKILRRRGIFDYTFWSYSILHGDLDNMREFFNSKEANLISRVGPLFESTLL